MGKARTFKLGTVEGGASDGGDIFAILECNPKVTFKYMLDGVDAIEKSAYDEAIRALKFYRDAREISPEDFVKEMQGDLGWVARVALQKLGEYSVKK